jgi:hypothetical protein
MVADHQGRRHQGGMKPSAPSAAAPGQFPPPTFMTGGDRCSPINGLPSPTVPRITMNETVPLHALFFRPPPSITPRTDSLCRVASTLRFSFRAISTVFVFSCASISASEHLLSSTRATFLASPCSLSSPSSPSLFPMRRFAAHLPCTPALVAVVAFGPHPSQKKQFPISASSLWPRLGAECPQGGAHND